MTSFAPSRPLVVALAAAALLSACQSSPAPVRRLPPPQQAPTVEGTWADQNGLVSTFAAGQIQTRTTDGTNSLLASGTYRTEPTGIIAISLYSTVKQTTSLVNCQMVTPSQLNCTTGANAQFSLTRRA